MHYIFYDIKIKNSLNCFRSRKMSLEMLLKVSESVSKQVSK